MDKDVICFSIMIGGALAAFAAIAGLRLKKKTIFAGLITGTVIAALNMLVEYAGARLDVYHVSGPWMLFRTPLPLTLGWVFLTFIFCAGYQRLVRPGRKKTAVLLYVLAGIAIGCLADYYFYSRAGILELGERGSPVIILFVWLVFVPFALFVYELLMGMMSENRERQ